jgi:hypothetical protein
MFQGTQENFCWSWSCLPGLFGNSTHAKVRGQAEEIAYAATFLVSDEVSQILIIVIIDNDINGSISSVFQPFYGCGTQNDQNKLCGTRIPLKKTLRNPNFSNVPNLT